jgi:HPr kinase/phosphorylase
MSDTPPGAHLPTPEVDLFDSGGIGVPCRLTVDGLVDGSKATLGLTWVAGRSGGARPAALPAPDTVDQVGYLNLIHPHRIQVLGEAEVAFFQRLSPQRREHILDELMVGRPPALILADGIDAPPALAAACELHGLPLLASRHPSARSIELLRSYLAKAMAVSCSLHGVLMDVLGMGVLISGESGLGKSEVGLELISRGHGLVADDVVELHRVGPTTIEGRCPPILHGLLEVRGLGLLDIKTVFGETAVRRKMRLKLIVHLVRRNTHEDEYERLPLEDLTQDVLGLQVRKVVIPVAAGRNLGVLVEAAVRNTILRLRGIDTMRDFIGRQRLAIDAGGNE